MEKENIKNKRLKKKSIKRILIFAAVAIFVLIFFSFLRKGSSNRGGSITSEIKESVSSSGPSVDVNHEFSFNAVNADADEVEINFTIVKAEKKNAIKVRGEERNLDSDKNYLLLRIELTNDTSQRLAFATADHIRLIGEGGKLFSADFHNGNVVIDPLSVRRDIAAYVVDKDSDSFKLQIGELEGDKQEIEINF